MKISALNRENLYRNFESVCRLCLRETNLKLNMFGEEGMRRETNQKILNCLSLIASESDRLPKYVCHSCLDKLDSFQDFRDQCHEAENILHSYLTSSEEKSSSPWSTVSKHTSVEIEPPRLDFVNVPVKVEAEERIIPKSENLRSCDFSGAVNSFDAFGGSQTTSGASNNLQSVVGAFVSPDEVCQSISTVQGSQDVPSQSVSFSESPEERFYTYNSDIAGQSQSVPDSYSDDDIQILDDDDSMGGEQKSVPEAAAGRGSSNIQSSTVRISTKEIRPDLIGEGRGCDIRNGSRSSCICPLCGKIYSRLQSLKYHLRIHSGEKPFGCKTCGKRFYVSSNLYIHERRHAGDKSVACSMCKKTFYNATELRKHMLRH